MDLIRKSYLIFFIILTVSSNSFLQAEEEDILIQSVNDQLQVLIKDLKTLEKAVYKKSDIVSSSTQSTMKSDGLNEDILTKHLLKLNEIEDQFRELTNKFEEINFKLDKLSSRFTKIQSDNQLRFSDIENNTVTEIKKTKVKKDLPGSSQPADFGANPGYSVSNLPQKQETNSIESAQTVITEEAEKKESLLPDKPPQDQYEFAVSFMKRGRKKFISKSK